MKGTVCKAIDLKPIQADMKSVQSTPAKTYGASMHQNKRTVATFIPQEISKRIAALFYHGLFFGFGVAG